jgi:hypothetical protein
MKKRSHIFTLQKPCTVTIKSLHSLLTGGGGGGGGTSELFFVTMITSGICLMLSATGETCSFVVAEVL